MSLFHLIKCPITSNTTNFQCVPDDIWRVYCDFRSEMTPNQIDKENRTNEVLRKLMYEWPDPE